MSRKDTATGTGGATTTEGEAPRQRRRRMPAADRLRNKTCPDCGATGTAEEGGNFYKTSAYCKDCHKRRIMEARQQPHRRAKINAYNRAWSSRHPEVNRRAVQAWRERQKTGEQPKRKLTYRRPPGRPKGSGRKVFSSAPTVT